jgi:AraC family transcriptional regulator, regulatory protein of adaptative response / methylated-DNA-[protein]-cysteine methyltransferase
MAAIDPDFAWNAFLVRDRTLDGQFIGAVKTTGIYCKPSCPARRPLRQNVEFFWDAAQAQAAGYRACMRCKPDEVGRDRDAVAAAIMIINREEGILSLQDLAAKVGYAPHHFHRLFKRDTGMTPAGYARKLRIERAQKALAQNVRITDAIYDAGYSGPSRFYADMKGKLGMTPSAWKNGGAGAVIRYVVADTSLGKMLVAATDKGICRLSFDEDEAELRRRFPAAIIEEGGGRIDEWVKGAIDAVERPSHMPDLPLDVAGTAFQQAVWAQLRLIPPGETRTYAQIAAAVGNPGAVRAAGTANGANNVAVLIPCHRVIRTDGGIGGYAYGTMRKEQLLAAEKES